MRLGLLSDAHGNPLGLAQCLAALRQLDADTVHFLGDAVGYMPGELEVIRRLLDEGAACQKGNHEAMLLGELTLDLGRDRSYRLAQARERLGPEGRALLAGWPDHRVVEVEGRRLLLVHGSPEDPLAGYVYPDSDVGALATLGYDAVVMGNTHRPFVRRLGEVLVVNVGSCGLPRDQGDLMSCAVYDSGAHECAVIRVRVAREDVLAQFAGADLPQLVTDCLARRAEHPFGRLVGVTG